MPPIQLDLNKLLGFKIVANEVNLKPQQVTLGAKLGEKDGIKNGIKAEMRIGAKIGDKAGQKGN